MFGSAGLTPAMHGGIRGRADDDDDDDDDGPSFKRDAISLDQVSGNARGSGRSLMYRLDGLPLSQSSELDG